MDGDEGGGAVGKMQGLVVPIEIVLLSAATAPLPPAKPQQSPLVRYFGPGRANERPAPAARVCDHGYGAEPHPGRLSAPILIFRFPTAATPRAPAPSPPW